MTDLVAADWGTSNRRLYRIEAGVVVGREADARGVLSMPREAFAAEAAAIRARHDGRPLLLAGMVGSTRGWVDAGYVPCPATIDDLASRCVGLQPGVAIVPGVCDPAGRGDVMRGEEVQMLGAAAAGLVPADALICQPGTHSKWARMRGGAIASFVTAMTGELFALLGAHALIGSAMTAPAREGAAFDDGVADGADGDLLARLFGVRAASLLGRRDDADAASYVSGLLIGAEVAPRLAADATGEVHLLADDRLGPLYARAIESLGARAIRVDSEAAFVAGITRIGDQLP